MARYVGVSRQTISAFCSFHLILFRFILFISILHWRLNNCIKRSPQLVSVAEIDVKPMWPQPGAYSTGELTHAFVVTRV